jgi:hypothetical protein
MMRLSISYYSTVLCFQSQFSNQVNIFCKYFYIILPFSRISFSSYFVPEELVGEPPVVDGIVRLPQGEGELPLLCVDAQVRGAVGGLHVLVRDAEPQAIVLKDRFLLQG